MTHASLASLQGLKFDMFGFMGNDTLDNQQALNSVVDIVARKARWKVLKKKKTKKHKCRSPSLVASKLSSSESDQSSESDENVPVNSKGKQHESGLFTYCVK